MRRFAAACVFGMAAVACATSSSTSPSGTAGAGGCFGVCAPAGGSGGTPIGSGGAPIGSGGLPVPPGAGGSGSGGAPGGGSNTTGGAAGSGAGGTGTPIPAPAPAGCVTAEHLTPGVHQVQCDTTIDVLTVPEQCTKTACGVIVDVHGGMMSSQMEDKNTNLSALGEKYGYLVIQPNALQNFLLLNQRLFVADAPGAPADDTRVMDILKNVMDAFHADDKRIHMTGFSEGGFMTWRWFCQHSDLLASVAPGAAAWKCANLSNANLTPPEVGCQFSGTDVPAHDIPVLFMQGSKDGLVDPKCVDSWLTTNVYPTLKLDAGKKIAGDATYTRTLFSNPDGVPFEFITHGYATTSSFLGFALQGHCYPGSTDLAVTPPAQTVIPPDQAISFGCNDTCSFDWGEEVMKFFIAHPKP